MCSSITLSFNSIHCISRFYLIFLSLIFFSVLFCSHYFLHFSFIFFFHWHPLSPFGTWICSPKNVTPFSWSFVYGKRSSGLRSFIFNIWNGLKKISISFPDIYSVFCLIIINLAFFYFCYFLRIDDYSSIF